jgi:fatty-acyl-CoA synthase
VTTSTAMPEISLGNWFGRRATKSPNRRALTFEGMTLTYGQLLDRIDRLAAGLRAGGVCHGDRVGFVGLNQPAFLETMFAAARLGAIFVPLNFRLTGSELTFIIGDAGIHTLVADAMHQGVVDTVRGDLPVRRYVGVDTDGNTAGDGWDAYAPLVEQGEPLAIPDPVDHDEVAVIMYTSGTTGRPKGAMLTHGNLWWNNTNALHMFDTLEDDVSLVVAPLFHIGGLNVTTLIAFQKGAEVVLHRSFDPGLCLEDIPKYGVTTMFGVPAMFLFMSQHPGFEPADLTSIRSLICGGAPVPEPLIKLYNGRGIPIQQGYGLTETSPSVTFLSAEHGLAKLGSAGRTPLFCDVVIMDPDGRVLDEPLARGEVCVRGPNVMKGYWNRPDATAAAIDPEGWFHTGDIGYVDEDGFLFIADRVKDMVISGGENVYPAEVESVLYEHPAVGEIAVIGLPDERWGEAVVAVVAPKAGHTVTLEDLREFGGRSLARFKLPTRLHLVDVLPRNPAGKVLKFELRDSYR